jgi:hypothetical protein
MKIKFILIFFCYFLLNFQVKAQDLVMRKLTDEDKKNKVHKAYEYNATDHYAVIKLCLYQDGTFYYTLNTFNQAVFSKGKWVQKDDTLILANGIKKGHVPIKLSYSNDSSALINGFKVAIVKNLKGEEMPDGLVAINNDSNICLPSYGGMCRSDYTSIDSIKIVFENGLTSEWLKIDNRYKQIIPVVQTNFLISSYMVFDNEKYLIQKTVLKPID